MTLSSLPAASGLQEVYGCNGDPETNGAMATDLANSTVDSFGWRDLTVTVKDGESKQPRAILSHASGLVRAGEMLAIMGPSGSGKTTLLNALACRAAAAGASTTGDVLVNGQTVPLQTARRLSAYVEQEDALIGSLTVQETLLFAARLSLASLSTKDAIQRVNHLVASFGLHAQSQVIVGTPIKKGLSGGQKKRLSVASRLVTNPKLLFLDEPTSGLDSALSLEVISYIKSIGRKNNLAIIASIHQPSTATFQQFDKLCLMSGGRICFFGHVADAAAYFARTSNFHIPPETSSAEYFLDLINTDLDKTGDIRRRTDAICLAWTNSAEQTGLVRALDKVSQDAKGESAGKLSGSGSGRRSDRPSSWAVMLVLLHRSWIKARRDVLAYGVRAAMYLGLAILMGTVFLRFKTEQQYIQPFINAIFFGGAFMSFMAVAYVPAFLEDCSTYAQERANGLVGPAAFLAANFAVGLPFLFLFALLFASVQYWLSSMAPQAAAFFRAVLWLFLDLLAAESLVVLVSSLFSGFVPALAVTAFANGLWMCVDGFLVPLSLLNPFWKYAFHYIDYQALVFQGMMVNELQHRVYGCATAATTAAALSGDAHFQCSYASDLNSVGKIRGTDVLRAFSIHPGHEGEWIGIVLAIIAGYRLLAYLVLVLRS